MTPIAHHWLDATHVSFGVLTAGFIHEDWKVEVSRFTGREPDQFRFNYATEGGDTIMDFSSAQNDKIGAWSTGFGAGLLAGPLDPAHFALDVATAANSQFVWVAASHGLYWDADGTGAGAAARLATLQGVTTLSASDIRVF